MPGIDIRHLGDALEGEARDVAAAQAAWQVASRMLRDPAIQFVLLDELNIALVKGYIDVEEVLGAVDARPPMQHVVITGRGAPDAGRRAASGHGW